MFQQIALGNLFQLLFLGRRNRFFRTSETITVTCLDFDKDQLAALARDKIDLTAVKPVVPLNNLVPLFLQQRGSEIFARLSLLLPVHGLLLIAGTCILKLRL